MDTQTQKKLDEKLIVAIDSASATKLRKALEAGANPNFLKPTKDWHLNHWPVLHYAIRAYCNGSDTIQLKMVKYLIEAGADIELRNSLDQTALLTAANFNKRKVMDLLCDIDADVTAQTRAGASAMDLLILGSNLDFTRSDKADTELSCLLKRLAKRGMTLGNASLDGQKTQSKCLKELVSLGSLETLETWLELGGKIDGAYENGQLFLHTIGLHFVSSKMFHPGASRPATSINHGVNQKREELEHAKEKSQNDYQIKAIELLLKYGADLNTMDFDGNRPEDTAGTFAKQYMKSLREKNEIMEATHLPAASSLSSADDEKLTASKNKKPKAL